MKIEFVGGARTVTGSSFIVKGGDFTVMVDCGMFQGKRELKERNMLNLIYAPREIDAMLLTHAHIDHSGLIPKIVKEGFESPIYATDATADLCSIMLPDSAHIQETDVEWINRKHKKLDREPVSPLWTSMFKAFGAAPTGINFSEVYSALQTKVVEGQENPLAIIDIAKLYEVQKYVSMTGHMWDGQWILANGRRWAATPPDVQALITRHVTEAVMKQRDDIRRLNNGLEAQLKAISPQADANRQFLARGPAAIEFVFERHPGNRFRSPDGIGRAAQALVYGKNEG